MRNLIFYIFIIVILFSYTSILKAEENQNSSYIYKKDPLFAAALSWFLPGIGQIYCEDWLKGTIFLFLDYALLFYTFSHVTEMNFTTTNLIYLNLTVNPDYISDPARQLNFTLFGILYLALHTYITVDAAFTAIQYNESHSDAEFERPSPFFAGLLSWIYPGLGQFYTRDYFTGSIFMFIDIAQKITGFLLVSSKIISSNVTNLDDPVKWDDLSINDKIFFVTYIAILIANRIISSTMAYDYASNNKSTSSNPSTVFIPYIDNKKIGFFIYAYY